MSAENRLTAEQLARLAPGDTVTIEISGNFRRPRICIGTVVRLEGSRLVVSTRSDRGVGYVHRFDRRDGVRVGGGQRAELVNAAAEVPQLPEERRREMRIDAAYRAWARSRGDVEKLRELQEAIHKGLEGAVASSP
ncbi:hypothetical protein ACI797_02610 [Geodermatophilus sp. SYSU D00691]